MEIATLRAQVKELAETKRVEPPPSSEETGSYGFGRFWVDLAGNLCDGGGPDSASGKALDKKAIAGLFNQMCAEMSELELVLELAVRLTRSTDPRHVDALRMKVEALWPERVFGFDTAMSEEAEG